MKLIDAPIGIFRFDGELVLKTEYCSENKLSGKYIPDCYIVRTGEYFWGGAKTANELNNLDVEPVDFAELLPIVTDTISRQAAIEALAEHEKSNGHNYTLFVDIVSECAEIIRNLPPAQPEQLGTNLAEVGTDCISRKAAIDAINHELRCGAVIDQCGLETAHDLIEELPSAQPEHIRGHWICDRSWSEGVGMGESYGHYWKCDKCGHLEQGDWGECGCNFCSNCGSDNREVTE